MTPSVCVIIPCRDEEVTIAGVVSGFRRTLPDARILVVDSSSADTTAQAAAGAGAEVAFVSHPGKGRAMRAGIERLKDESAVVFIDGDGTYSPDDAPGLLSPVLEGRADMACGERLSRAEHGALVFPRRVGNLVLTWALNRLLGSRTTDALTGYRVLSRDLLDRLELDSDGFEIETELLARVTAAAARVVEVPISYAPRHAGSKSKLAPATDALKILRTAVRLSGR